MQLFDRIRNETPMRDYLVNEIVLATVPGYVPWPARLLSIDAQTITVQFFGTGQMYVSDFSKLGFNLNYYFMGLFYLNFRNLLRSTGIRHFEVDKILPLLGRKGYKKAVQKLELALGVPKSASLVWTFRIDFATTSSFNYGVIFKSHTSTLREKSQMKGI